MKRETAAPPARARYHHGGLRDALIAASMQLIEETRLESFTVAQVARAAGVSSGAPYRHFADREDLLDHVAAAGFEALGQESEAAWRRHPAGSIEGLVAGGCAYVRFGATRPELFHLMWGATRPHGADSRATAAGLACHDGFLARLRTVLDAQGLGHLDIMEVSTPLWALVHGLASLLVGENPKIDGGDVAIRRQIDLATRAYLGGLRAQAGHG